MGGLIPGSRLATGQLRRCSLLLLDESPQMKVTGVRLGGVGGVDCAGRRQVAEQPDQYRPSADSRWGDAQALADGACRCRMAE